MARYHVKHRDSPLPSWVVADVYSFNWESKTWNWEARMPQKNYEAQMPTPHGKLPEMDWFESSIGKPVKLTTLTGKTVTGVLVSYSTYSILLQSSPSEFPVMYFKHGLASIER